MFKVLFWDYAGVSAQWLEQVGEKNDIEVVGTITPKDPVPEILLKRDAWDWLLIFEQGARQFFDATIQTLRLPPDKVIYALDMNSWLQKPKAVFVLTDPLKEIGNNVLLNLNFAISQQLGKYLTCTVEGLSYVASAKDDLIMRKMYTQRVHWAAEDMKNFHALAHKYYNVDDSAGYFLDLGANIGTTGIYFVKKLTPNLKVLAFEPDVETFKLLCVNLILNGVEANIDIVNYGLGDKLEERTFYRRTENPGGNSIFQYKNNMSSVTITIIPLDAYLAENNIAAQAVKYIWIDTEGFEPQVLLGAKNLLRENPAPIFMECNLGMWKSSGGFEPMMELLAEHYSHFLLFEEGKETLCPLEALYSLEARNTPLGRRGDIFLIRKGAIV